MSIITTRILQSNFELIRDRIAAVLADEFTAQAAYGDTDIADLVVWVSRTIAFDKTEMPAINVNFHHGDYFAEDADSDTNIYKYSIDCHGSGKSTVQGERGEVLAMIRMQKIMGIACRILNDTRYRTLLFAAPSIQTRWIENMDIGEVVRGDADSLQFGRIIYAVKINEDIALKDANLIKGYETTVKMDLSDKGYFFKVNSYA